MNLQLLVVVVIASILQLVHGETVIFCYYRSSAYYGPGTRKFTPHEIRPKLCTHIGYSYFSIYSAEIIVLDKELDLNNGNIAKTIALKEENPNLKVLATVGGWNEGSVKFSAMAGNSFLRAKFISNTLAFIKEHGFDGLDLDWEYPGQRGGDVYDRVKFVTLLKGLKEALSAEGLLLTIAVAAAEPSASRSYDIPNVAAHVDFVNVMTYDFMDSESKSTGHNAAMSGSDDNNVNSAIEYWLKAGAPSDKLVLGIAFFGRTFTLQDPAQTTPGSPSSGPEQDEAGVLAYGEMCEGFNSSGSWNIVWDSTYSVPYAFKDDQWISYDNEQSVKVKVDYIKAHNLRGAMLWTIDQDDIHGFCAPELLLEVIHRELLPDIASSSTTTSTTTPSPPSSTSSTTSPPTTSTDCTQTGTFQNPDDCSRFYMCQGGIRYDFDCPDGLHYDEVRGVCNWPSKVWCKSQGVYSGPVATANKICY